MTPEEAKEAIDLSGEALELDRQDAMDRHMARVAKIREKCEHNWIGNDDRQLCTGCWLNRKTPRAAK